MGSFGWRLPTPATTAPAAISSTPTAATAPVTTPTVTAPTTATRVGLVVVITRGSTTHSVLHIGVQALGVKTSRRALLIKTLLVLLHVCLAVRVLLLIALFALLGFLLCLLRVDVVPAPVVVLLPTGASVLVDVAVVAGVHVSTGILPRVGIAERGGSAVAVASLRTLDGSNAAVCR